MALVDITHGKTRHVHYRDSKLTFLLRVSYILFVPASEMKILLNSSLDPYTVASNPNVIFSL